jgi:hypothetical protein
METLASVVIRNEFAELFRDAAAKDLDVVMATIPDNAA